MANAVRSTVVVGGGLVGSAAACAIGSAHGGLGCGRLALLDHAKDAVEPPSPDRFSNRVTALTPKSVKFLQETGVWSKVQTMRSHRVAAMQVWDGISDGCIWLDGAEAGLDTMTTMVENDVLQHAMNLRMGELPSVEVLRGVTVTDVSHRRRDDRGEGFATSAASTASSCAAVVLESGDEVLGKLVVGADGPRSIVKRCGGFDTVGWRYDQTALVATVSLVGAGANEVAWQRFLPTGPVALLPLSDTVSSIVWSTTAERAKELVGMEPSQFVAELNDAFNGEVAVAEGGASRAGQLGDVLGKLTGHVAGALEAAAANLGPAAGEGSGTSRRDPPFVVSVDEGSRASFPLSLAHANQYVRPRLALAGDAAHKVHPLAGQGLNLGLGDAEELATTIADAHSVGLDVGNIHGLMKYERTRQRDVVPVVLATDFFKRIFSTDNMAVAAVRGLGVRATDSLIPVKSAIIKSAMGI